MTPFPIKQPLFGRLNTGLNRGLPVHSTPDKQQAANSCPALQKGGKVQLDKYTNFHKYINICASIMLHIFVHLTLLYLRNLNAFTLTATKRKKENRNT